MYRRWRRRVRELPDGVDYAPPDRHTRVVTSLGELIGTSSAFHLGRVAVPPEH